MHTYEVDEAEYDQKGASDMQVELDRLTKALVTLHEEIDGLLGALAPVLRAEVPEPVMADSNIVAAVPTPTSPMVERLRDAVNGIRGEASRIDMLVRLRLTV